MRWVREGSSARGHFGTSERNPILRRVWLMRRVEPLRLPQRLPERWSDSVGGREWGRHSPQVGCGAADGMSVRAEAESDRVCGQAIAMDFGAVLAMCLDSGAWEAYGQGLPRDAPVTGSRRATGPMLTQTPTPPAQRSPALSAFTNAAMLARNRRSCQK